MRNLLNPRWLFLINTLPIAVLFFLFGSEYSVIKSLLTTESLKLWRVFGITLGILGVLNFIYALRLTFRKQNVSILYGILALICYITFIYLFGYHFEKIIPWSIPRWMISENNILFVGTFLMPTLAYSLFILVAHFTMDAAKTRAWKSFTIALLIPLSWYIFIQIILPLWKPLDSNFNEHFAIVFAIIFTIIFLFFLIRGVFIIATKKVKVWQNYQLAWKIPIALILPVIGLAVNNGDLFNNFGHFDSGVFGDFSSAWFYILACLNALFICLPNLNNKPYRTLLFIGRSITFAYTFYFFLVFLPFLPLSIFAIVAVGTGFLMLTPLLLFVLHINELSNDFAFLKAYYSKTLVWIISILGFILIPILITIDYTKDRLVLNETLDYIYNPDYSKEYNIDKESLQKTLNVLDHHKSRNQDLIFGGQLPYLTSYFNWLVLDNLTISSSKINIIEKIFFGTQSYDYYDENIRNEDVKITKVSSESTYNKGSKSWLSWVDLEITNQSENSGFSEFATTLELPEGSWICDYYLFIGKKKEMGILAEKKSAMWVFSNIRNENKDPGILHYLTGNRVAFRIFPFAKDEVRKSGFQVVHKEPIQLNLQNQMVKLGQDEKTEPGVIDIKESVVYVSGKQKQSLKQIKRKPYWHFLVDISSGKENNAFDYAKSIEKILDSNKSMAENAKISFVNTYNYTLPISRGWQQKLKSKVFDGGFYLDRAIKTNLYHAYKDNTTSYPVFVVITDSLLMSVLDKDFSDFKMTYPENDVFFNVSKTGKLIPHSLLSNPIKHLPDTIGFTFDKSVLEYSLAGKTYYLPNNNQPSIVLKEEVFEIADERIQEKDWKSALYLQGKWNSHILHPENSEKEWLSSVRYSFKSKVLTPLTSYLVVENEAQKAILKKKQEQVLASNKSLDLDEESMRMSEPGFVIMAILLLVGIYYLEGRNRRLRNIT